MVKLNLELKGIKKIPELMEEAVKMVPPAVAPKAVSALQAGDSLWPVKTGLSKASFGATTRKNVVSITNSQDYAEHVEERTGLAELTLRRKINKIAKDVEKELTR